MYHLSLIDSSLCLIGSYLFYGLYRAFAKTTHLPPPPGPRALPIIGNLLDLPTGFEAAHWAKHAKKYGALQCLLSLCTLFLGLSRAAGPISSVNVFGQTLVIVNDQKTVEQLLEKQSVLSSSRTCTTFITMYVRHRPEFQLFGCNAQVNVHRSGYNRVISMLPYGDKLRTARKMILSYFGARRALEQFEELEEIETRRFLYRAAHDPGNLTAHMRKSVLFSHRCHLCLWLRAKCPLSRSARWSGWQAL